MVKNIQIDFISDAVCPWCAIGYTRLKQAITQLKLEDKVSINWQPFFLNPEMPSVGENIYDYGTRKYGRSKQEGDLNRVNITELGKQAGFKFNFTDESRVVNTKDAHTLLEYAANTGKQTQLKEALFNAFFTQQQDISKRDVLNKIAQNIGLEISDIEDVLDNSKTQNHVAEKVLNWHKVGITSVPTLIFNDRTVLSGSRPVEAYKQILSSLI